MVRLHPALQEINGSYSSVSEESFCSLLSNDQFFALGENEISNGLTFVAARRSKKRNKMNFLPFLFRNKKKINSDKETRKVEMEKIGGFKIVPTMDNGDMDTSINACEETIARVEANYADDRVSSTVMTMTNIEPEKGQVVLLVDPKANRKKSRGRGKSLSGQKEKKKEKKKKKRKEKRIVNNSSESESVIPSVKEDEMRDDASDLSEGVMRNDRDTREAGTDVRDGDAKLPWTASCYGKNNDEEEYLESPFEVEKDDESRFEDIESTSDYDGAERDDEEANFSGEHNNSNRSNIEDDTNLLNKAKKGYIESVNMFNSTFKEKEKGYEGNRSVINNIGDNDDDDDDETSASEEDSVLNSVLENLPFTFKKSEKYNKYKVMNIDSSAQLSAEEESIYDTESEFDFPTIRSDFFELFGC